MMRCVLNHASGLWYASRGGLRSGVRRLSASAEGERGVFRSRYKNVEIPKCTVGQFMWRELPLWADRTALVCGGTGRQVRYAELRRMCASLAVSLRRKLRAQPDDCVAIMMPNAPEFPVSALGSTINILYKLLVRQVCGGTGRQVRYAELRRMCASLAVSLRRKLRAQPDDCVAIMMPNAPEFPVAALGSLDAGCVVSTINILYTKDEVARQLLMSGAKFVVTTNSAYANVKQAADTIKRDIKIIVVDDNKKPTPEGAIRFEELSQDPNPDLDYLKDVNRSPEDVAFLPYSSGTTGMPKGVELTHQNVVASICQQTMSEELMLTLKCTNEFQDSMLCVVPFFHISGLMVQMMSRLCIGNKLVTMPRFHPDDFVRLQRQHRTTAMLAAPPLALFLANHPDVTPELMASFRNLLFGAAPCAEGDLNRIYEKGHSNLTIAQGYGLTESSGVGIANKAGSHNFASCGFMVANSEIRIVSAEDSETSLGYNEVGELWTRGPHIMRGYKDNEQATREALVEGCWLRTGDLGYCDRKSEEFYIVDRLKDLIKVKGYQVAPAELEGVLRLHPQIGDAAVVGVPHDAHGETPKAYIVTDGDVAPAEIMRFVAERVAPYKRLGHVECVDEIPRSPAGKVLRRELRAVSS